MKQKEFESGAEEGETTVSEPNSEVSVRTQRLKLAVKSAGGATVVSARSGVPLGTLNHHLLGREMKASTLVALARACSVSVDWLATGRQPRPSPLVDPDLGELDPFKLGSAIVLANLAFAEANREQEPENLGRIVTIIYKVLRDSEDPVTVARLMVEMIDRLRSPEN